MPGSTLDVVETKKEIQEFLTSRRAAVTPEQAGVPSYGARRVRETKKETRESLPPRRAAVPPERAGVPPCGAGRARGRRRKGVAARAGVGVPYYPRLERGDLSGVSEGVLEALARALKLDDA